MRRVFSVICLALGAALLLLAFKNWRTDRSHLGSWHHREARIDSARVVPVPRTLPYTLGGHGALLAFTMRSNGDTVRGRYVDPAWARLSPARAQRDANEALARGRVQVLVDPADPYHISVRPDNAVYFYRDAWQAALLGALFLVVGIAARMRRDSDS